MKTRFFHGSLKKHDSDLTWYDFSFNDVLFDDLTVLGTWLLPLGTQKVTSREMDELKLIHYALALRAFAGAWTAEDEDHCCIFLLHDIKLLRSYEKVMVF